MLTSAAVENEEVASFTVNKQRGLLSLAAIWFVLLDFLFVFYKTHKRERILERMILIEARDYGRQLLSETVFSLNLLQDNVTVSRLALSSS